MPLLNLFKTLDDLIVLVNRKSNWYSYLGYPPPPARYVSFFNLSVFVRHQARYGIGLMASVLFYRCCNFFSFLYVVITV